MEDHLPQEANRPAQEKRLEHIEKDIVPRRLFLYIIFTDVNHDQADYGGSHKQSKLQHR